MTEDTATLIVTKMCVEYLFQTALLQQKGCKVLGWFRRAWKVCDGLLQSSLSITLSLQLSQ